MAVLYIAPHASNRVWFTPRCQADNNHLRCKLLHYSRGKSEISEIEKIKKLQRVQRPNFPNESFTNNKRRWHRFDIVMESLDFDISLEMHFHQNKISR